MNEKFIRDYERFTPNKYNKISSLLRMIKNHELRYIYFGRMKGHSSNKATQKFVDLILHGFRRKYGLEMNFSNIGGCSIYSPMEYNGE